jgi:hypothetical protein
LARPGDCPEAALRSVGLSPFLVNRRVVTAANSWRPPALANGSFVYKLNAVQKCRGTGTSRPDRFAEMTSNNREEPVPDAAANSQLGRALGNWGRGWLGGTGSDETVEQMLGVGPQIDRPIEEQLRTFLLAGAV